MKRPLAHKSANIVTITTDFGLKDTFVGQMKGVILSINKSAKIIDITHEIEPFAVVKANYLITDFYKYFPLGTVHIAVVDPGVGSERRGIIIDYKGHFFVGPDNGIFSSILSERSEKTVVEITNPKYILNPDSPTFQGRDVFASVGGWLSLGINIDEFGRIINNPYILDICMPNIGEDTISGYVILIDRFGNCITNIKKDDIKDMEFTVIFREKPIYIARYYEEAKGRGLSCIINSSGYLELFTYMDRASDSYGIKEGQIVTVKFYNIKR